MLYSSSAETPLWINLLNVSSHDFDKSATLRAFRILHDNIYRFCQSILMYIKRKNYMVHQLIAFTFTSIETSMTKRKRKKFCLSSWKSHKSRKKRKRKHFASPHGRCSYCTSHLDIHDCIYEQSMQLTVTVTNIQRTKKDTSKQLFKEQHWYPTEKSRRVSTCGGSLRCPWDWGNG